MLCLAESGAKDGAVIVILERWQPVESCPHPCFGLMGHCHISL